MQYGIPGAAAFAVDGAQKRLVWPYNRGSPTLRGGMGERLIPAVLKTVVPERAPGVRIPLPPPFILYNQQFKV